MTLTNDRERPPGKPDGYHHGDLRAALIDATDRILAESGIEGFSLRDAARRAGVSPGAPAHHFGNASGLLTAVAVLAYRELRIYLDRADRHGTPEAWLRALATQYVRFALDHPGRFRLMFRKDLINRADPGYKEASTLALGCFAEAAAARQGRPVEAVFAERAFGPVLAAWATAHGIAHLALEEKMAGILDADDPRRDFLDRLLPSIVADAWPDPSPSQTV